MTDYSFMKTGSNMMVPDDDINKKITTLVATFASEGIRHANRYVKHHSTRNIILPQDIKRAMMLEALLFNNRDNLDVLMKEIEKIIYVEEEEEE